MIIKETLTFLSDLKANNSREWFEANKARYEDHLKHPAAEFAPAMAEALGMQTGHDYSFKIFRTHRDVRFSKDKTPYNAYLRMSFAPGGNCAAAPVWMMSLEPDSLVLGAGIFAFDKDVLALWRNAIDGANGEGIAKDVARLTKKGVRFCEPDLKRVPAPYDKDHPREALLRQKGFTCWLDDVPQETVLGSKGPGKCAKACQLLRPVFEHLLAL